MSVGAVMRDVPAFRFGMTGAGRTTVFQLAVALAIALAVAVVGRADSTVEWLGAAQSGWWPCLGAFAVQALVFGLFFPRGNPERQAT